MSENRMLTNLMRPFFRKGKNLSFSLPGTLDENSRILCIDAGDLAELVFHVPLLKAIRKNHPAAAIDFLLPEKHQALVAPSGLAKECLVYKEGQLNPWRPSFGKLLRDLGTGQYDVTIVMSRGPAPRLELAALASGAALRLGPSHAESWPSINFEIRPSAQSDPYFGDRLLSAGVFLNLPARDMNPRWPLPMEAVRQMAQQVHFHKPNPDQMLIGVDPGPDKAGSRLDLEDLHFLVRQLSTQFVCRVLPLGQEESERLQRFETKLPDPPLGLPRETLQENVLLLSQCDLFVAGNTDFFHLAVSLGLPTLGLFGAEVDEGWVPRDRKRVRVLRLDKEGKVDIETLMEAVEGITDGRSMRTAKIIEKASDDPDPSPADHD